MTADSRACVGLDVMLKASFGTPELSECEFIGLETANAGIFIEAC